MSQQNNNEDDIWNMLAIPIGIVGFLVLAYFLYAENKVLVNTLVVGSAMVLLFPFTFISNAKADFYEQLKQADMAQLGLMDLMSILNVSALPYTVLLVGLAGYFIWNIFSRDLYRRYSRFFDMVTLVDNNAKILPYLKPIINRGKLIIDEPAFSGAWALPVKPIQWIAKHQLLIDRDNKPFPNKMMIDAHGMPQTSPDKTPLLSQSVKVRQSLGAHLDKARTEALLREQIGERLESDREKIVDTLKDYELGMVAALIAYGLGEKKRGYGYICTMAESFVEGEWNEQTKTATGYQIDIGDAYDYVKGVLSKKELDDQLELTFKIHGAYKYTWMMSLLEDFASKKNVFNSALYVGFLRPTDNRLFLALNQVGSNTGWIESYGIWAHYEMEKVSRYAIMDTDYSIELAMKYLEQYLTNQGWMGWDSTSYSR